MGYPPLGTRIGYRHVLMRDIPVGYPALGTRIGYRHVLMRDIPRGISHSTRIAKRVNAGYPTWDIPH